MRMITREETTLCLKGKLHCYALFDGRMPSVELTHGIQSIDPVVIEHYRHCMDRFAKEEAPRYFRRMVAWRRENWAPIRDKISPARAIERLRRWLRAPEQEPRTE